MKHGATSKSDPLACSLSYYVLYSEIPVVVVVVVVAPTKTIATRTRTSTSTSTSTSRHQSEEFSRTKESQGGPGGLPVLDQRQTQTTGTIDDLPVHHSEEEHVLASKIEPWVEDHWTVEEEVQAAALLEANISRCRVVPLHTSARTRTRTRTRSTAAADTATAAAAAADTAVGNKKNITAWNRFYSNHTTNFFKDRHYLSIAFPHEFGALDVSTIDSTNHTKDTKDRNSKHQRPNTGTPSTGTGSTGSVTGRQHRCLVEIGCGVGNTMLPLLECNQEDSKETDNERKVALTWTVHGIDLSEVAVALIHQDERFQQAHARGQATAQVFDITTATGNIPPHLRNVATVTSLLFCLSAIDPVHHTVAVRNATETVRRLQPGNVTHNGNPNANTGTFGGGIVVFRDYGRFDAAHLKLGTQRGKLLSTSSGSSTVSNDDNNNDDDDNNSIHSHMHASWYRKHDGTQCYYFTVHEVIALFEAAGMETVECDYIKRVYRNRSTGTARRRVWVQGRFRLRQNVIVERRGGDKVPVNPM